MAAFSACNADTPPVSRWAARQQEEKEEARQDKKRPACGLRTENWTGNSERTASSFSSDILVGLSMGSAPPPAPPPSDTADGPCAMPDIECSSRCGAVKLLCVGTTALPARCTLVRSAQFTATREVAIARTRCIGNVVIGIGPQLRTCEPSQLPRDTDCQARPRRRAMARWQAQRPRNRIL
jgi:hypothetical protein